MEYRATEFLKSRVGEAIVESTLLYFGYRVERTGRKNQVSSDTWDTTPDLLVTDPNDNRQTYLEVKLRPSHPLKVKVEKVQVDRLRSEYPESLLVFVSAFNGSINCLETDSPVLDDEKLSEDGFYELDLLAKAWKPLWESFPLVDKGDKTDSLWHDLKSVLDDFAAGRMTKSKDNEFFAEELEALKNYINKHLHPGMLAQDINSINLDQADIAAIWNHALAIHAFRFAFEMCGEDNMDHPAFSQVMDKVLGKIGERYITIPYQDIKDSLSAHPELYGKLQVLEDEVRKTPPYDTAVVLMEGLLEIIPPGIGKAYILPEKDSKQDMIEVDYHTILTLLQRRNCLYD